MQWLRMGLFESFFQRNLKMTLCAINIGQVRCINDTLLPTHNCQFTPFYIRNRKWVLIGSQSAILICWNLLSGINFETNKSSQASKAPSKMNKESTLHNLSWNPFLNQNLFFQIKIVSRILLRTLNVINSRATSSLIPPVYFQNKPMGWKGLIW